MTLMAILIYVGGVSAAEEAGIGSWRSVVWPICLGRALVQWSLRINATGAK
jgi:hypothetical protein